MIKTNTKSYDKHPLSQSWQNTQRMASNRVSFFGKGITYIDKLDPIHQRLLHTIKQLDLSHNVIVRIENIKQFPNLQVINLAHNHIIDGKNLLKLERLRKLKVVMVKGNPFLKSGEGKFIALKFLLAYQTDIEILNNLTEQLLNQSINKFCLLEIKKQYYKHIELQIELITEFNVILPDQCTGQIYSKIVQQVVENCLENVVEDCRKEVIRCISRDHDNGFNGLESKEILQEWFKGCLEEYDEGLDRQLENWNKLIEDKEQILNHVKKMRKQKHSKSVQTFGLKKITKPLLVKPTNNQNIPRAREISPRKQQTNKFSFLSSFESQQPSQIMPLSKKNLQQKFQSYYNVMLIKYNPVYQLLYSPLPSLKNKQKDMLIETLSTHLKQKSFAVYKCEKIKEQYNQLNRRYSQKEKLLKTNEEKFMGFKIGMNERVALAQQNNERKDKIIDELNYKISLLMSQKSQMTKRLQYLQQELSEYKLKSIKQNNQIQKTITEEYLTEQIENIRKQRIKKQHIKILQNKADKLHKLRKTQLHNKNQENKEMVQLCFRFIRSQAENTRLSKFIANSCLKNRVKDYMGNFYQNGEFLIRAANFGNKIKQWRSKSFFNLFAQRFQEKKKQKNIVNLFLVWQKRKDTSAYFKEWKLSMEDRKNEQNAEKANAFYKFILKRKMFKSWLVYMKLPIFQEAELSVDLKISKMNKFLYLLKQNSIISNVLQAKFLNLVVFLNRNKRIHHFFKFKKFAVLNSELRNLKEKRLTLILKSNYFYEFFKVSHMMKKYRSQKQTKETKLISYRKKLLFSKFNSEAYTKQLQIKRLKKIVQIYRKMSIAQSLRQSLKQFMIEDKRNKTDIKTFFSLLQVSHHRKLKISNKSIQLKLMLNTNQERILENFRNKKYFFESLQEPKRYKNKLKEFLNKKYYNLMLKHFNQWRVDVFRTQIEYLKGRISEFGPEIEEISKRQKSVYEEKQVLMNIIDNKEKTIKVYVKQLEQAEYTIKTKQEKYKKLKDFLHESGGQDLTVVGSKVQPSFLIDSNSRPERDYDTFLEEERKDYFNSFRRF